MKLQECMFNKTKMMAIAIFVMAIFVSSCSDTQQVERKTEVKKETKAPKKSNGVLYKPSELALLMRGMYDNMKLVGEFIDKGETIPDSLLTGYETITTAIATNPDEIGPKFQGFAKGWLMEVETMRTTPTNDNYNAIMNACVNCHKAYCPGPIPKIKRLKIIPD